MGWVAEPGKEEGDTFPVDILVNKLKDEATGIETVCEDYHGQARKCCDGIRTCFVTLQESFSTVKLQAIGNQNMHKACLRLTTDYEATKSCIVSWTSYCHSNVNTEQLSAPFRDTLDRLNTLLDETCSDLPPEGTTFNGAVWVGSTSTASRKTTSTAAATTTTTPAEARPTTVILSTTASTDTSTSPITSEDTVTESSHNDVSKVYVTPTYNLSVSTIFLTDEPGTPNHPSNNRPGPSPSTSTSSPSTSSSTQSVSTTYSSVTPTKTTSLTSSTLSENSDLLSSHGDKGSGSDNTIMIISSAVGSVLFLGVIVLCIFIMYRKRQHRNADSGGSYEPGGKPRFLSWLFASPKKLGSEKTDTEIYAEIDEAFMEAVYKYDKEKPRNVRDRISSNSQFNMCYESGLKGDDIIRSRDKLNTVENNIKIPLEPLNPLALIRKEDDAITSFQSDQSKAHERQSIPDALIDTKTGFLTRRPGFTDMRPESTGGEYVYIEAKQNDNVFLDTQNYAVPGFAGSEYDTVEYGRNPDRDIHQAVEQNHYSYLVYKNEPNVQLNVKEYKRSSSDVETHVYENQDTLMEY